MSAIHKIVSAAEAASPDVSPEVIARAVVAQMDDARIREVLVEVLTERVNHARRARVRERIERPSQRLSRRPSATERRQASWSSTAQHRSHLAEVEAEKARERDFAQRIATEGPEAIYAQFRERAERKYREKLTAEITIELTAAVLGAPVRLYDGREVAMGDMTLADHLQRVDRLIANAAGTGKSIAHHFAAYRMLMESGARTLRELAERNRPGAA